MLRRSTRLVSARASATGQKSPAQATGPASAGDAAQRASQGGRKRALAKPEPKGPATKKRSHGRSTDAVSDAAAATAPSPAQLIDALEVQFRARASPERAREQKKYMRDQFEYFGLQSPERRAVMAEVVRSVPLPPTQAWLQQLFLGCWARPQREFQYFAQDFASELFKCDVAAGKRPRMDVDDSFMDFLGDIICQKSWWDTIDCLSPNIVGPIVYTNPHLLPKIDAWARHENKWLRRSALLYQLKFKSATDFGRLSRYILLMAADEDFFIRKAIGWALRQYAYTDKTAVRNFVKEHDARLSQLSKREATKHI